MEALQTVFAYIEGVLKIIRDFLAKIFPQPEEEGTEDESTEA